MNTKRFAASLLIAGGLLFTPQTMPLPYTHSIFVDNFIEVGDEKLWDYTVVPSEDGVSSSPFAKLTAYKGKGPDINIPRTIGGYPVLKLGKGFISSDFSEKEVSLYIPDTVKASDAECLDFMFYMTVYTEDGMVYDCLGPELQLLGIPAGEKEVYIPDDVAGIPVTSMTAGIFSSSAVEKLRLSDHFTNVSISSKTLKEVNIPKGMKIIPSDAFSSARCPNLKNVTFHDGINLIARDAFSGLDITAPQDKVVYNLTPILYNSLDYNEADVETGWAYTINIDSEGKPKNCLLCYAPTLQGAAPTEYRGIPIIDIPVSDQFPANMPYMIIREGVKSTVNFYNTTPQETKKVDILSTDVNFEKYLLKNAAITELTFPGSAELQTGAVSECAALKEVTFSGKDAVLNIGGEAFINDISLSNVNFPEKCKDLIIGKYAFQNTAIGELVIPEGTSLLDIGAFYKNDSLKKVTIDGSPTMNSSALGKCGALEEITFNGSPTMERGAFESCPKLKNINVDITKPINGGAFLNCPSLTKINSEEVFNEDGSPVEKYRSFIEKNFYDSENNGIVDNYAMYCVKKTVSETITDGMNDMEKVKALHDKLCSLTSYDGEDTSAKKNHTDVSVFLNETSVCEGYARAMNLLLHEAGIESCYVFTETHAWVIAKVGGHYFHIDPTWDDVSTIRYDWFMLSDDQVAVDKSHTGFETKIPSDLHSFQWTEMPKCSEKMGDVNGDGIIDGNDATAILSSYAKASAGGEMTVDMTLADVNFNGRVDAADASAVLTKYAKSSV